MVTSITNYELQMNLTYWTSAAEAEAGVRCAQLWFYI